MAMFVLVVDTSMMNVSISAVVDDLGTTVSGVQSAIALEALVSAAFILIGSKVGDLIGRKRAYVLGLLGYAIGAIAMTLTQSLLADHNFLGNYRRVGRIAVAACHAVADPWQFRRRGTKESLCGSWRRNRDRSSRRALIGGFITTYLSWRVGFFLEFVIIMIVLANIKLVKDVPYTGPREVDVVGSILSVLGMGGIVLSILVWQEGGEYVGLLMAVGVVAMFLFARWLIRRKKQGKPTLLDPELFSSKYFRLGVSEQMLQNIALGGMMIALPIYFQMVFEYTAMQTGLALAPFSLSIFAVALLAGRRAGNRRPSRVIQAGFAILFVGITAFDSIHPTSRFWLELYDPLA